MPGADLSDVKAQLRITGNANDALLQLYLDAATRVVEKECGPLSVVSVSEAVNTRANAILLSTRPVVSITSLTPLLNTWPSFTGSDVEFDPLAGTVWRKDLGTLAGAWTVAYTAGNQTVTENMRLAQLLVVQDLWAAVRRGGTSTGSTDVEPTVPMLTRRRVREVLADDALYNGIA